MKPPPIGGQSIRFNEALTVLSQILHCGGLGLGLGLRLGLGLLGILMDCRWPALWAAIRQHLLALPARQVPRTIGVVFVVEVAADGWNCLRVRPMSGYPGKIILLSHCGPPPLQGQRSC